MPARIALAPADGLGLGHGALGRRQRLVERVDAAEQRAELEATEDLLQLGPVGWLQHEPGGVDTEVEVPPHRCEELGGPSLLRVLGDRLRARGRQLGRMLDDLLERAVLRDQLPCGLVPDPGDPRDVVARVALETDEVRNLVGADPVPGLDPLGGVHLHVGDAAWRHHQADVLRHELERVAVGRDDARLDARLVRAGGERGDHVVGLPALELEVLVPERLDDRTEVRKLLAEEIGHRTTLGLVLGVDLLAVHGSRVPCDCDTARPVVGEELEEHVREAEERVRRLPVRRLQLLGQREEAPVRQVVAVDEEELCIARRRVVELKLLSRQRLRHSIEFMRRHPRDVSQVDG